MCCVYVHIYIHKSMNGQINKYIYIYICMYACVYILVYPLNHYSTFWPALPKRTAQQQEYSPDFPDPKGPSTTVVHAQSPK